MNSKEHRLLDHLIQHFSLKNDSALAKRLSLSPPLISKIRNEVSPVTDSILLAMHLESGISVDVLRFLKGDFRESTSKTAKILSPDVIAERLKSEQVAA